MNVHQLVRKPKLKTSKEAPIVCSRDEQSDNSSNKEQFIDRCPKKEQFNTACTRNVENKNCQAEKCDMWPVKFQMDMQSEEPAKQSSFKKKHVPLYKDKNCKVTKSHKKQKECEYNDSNSQSFKCSDKNCQEKENNNMQSVTNNTNMWLPKPAIRRLCKDKNCQSTGFILYMTRTVNLMCHLNLKDLYYHCYMCTAMKTIDMQTVPELLNISYDCQWIVHSLKCLGTLSIPQASAGMHLGCINCLLVVPDYR